MKRFIIIITLIVFACSTSYSQKVFMYGENGKKIYFQETDSLVQLKYKKEATNDRKSRIAKMVNSNFDIKNFQTNREIIPVDKRNKPDFEELKKDSFVLYVNKSLINDDGNLQIPTSKVLVKIKSQYKLEDVLKELHIAYESYKRLGHDEHSYVINLNTGESLDVANQLYESGYFEYAQPSFTPRSA